MLKPSLPVTLATAIQPAAAELARAGAAAVVLFGSHASGQPHAHSDIDLLAVGAGPGGGLSRRAGQLFSIQWATPEDIRAQFSMPLEVGTVIPGWREAVILHDPQGIAAGLQAEARRWTWAAVPGCDALVVSSHTSLAEEVHKLVGALENGWAFMAAVQRNLLAVRVPILMGIHLRILHGTENVLWDRVAAQLDGRWAAAQARAFGLGAEPLADSSRAALELYALAAEALAPQYDATQRAVVAHACQIAGYPLE